MAVFRDSAGFGGRGAAVGADENFLHGWVIRPVSSRRAAKGNSKFPSAAPPAPRWTNAAAFPINPRSIPNTTP
jgi:hypothetical protein